MFQYAFIRGVAANRGFDWMIPPEDADRLDNYGLFDAFELKNCDLNKNTGEPFYKAVEYRDMHFNEEIYERCEDNTNFSGNFQTERYFDAISPSIREDFTFKGVPGTRVKSLLILLVDVISASFCMFVEVIQTLLGAEGKSGLTRWCKSTTHSVKMTIMIRLPKSSPKTNKSSSSLT